MLGHRWSALCPLPVRQPAQRAAARRRRI